MSKNNVYKDKQRQTKTCSREKGAKDAEQKETKTYKGISKKEGTEGTGWNKNEKEKKNKREGGVVGGTLKESEGAYRLLGVFRSADLFIAVQ